jgi:hypothetical protein
MRVLLCNNRSGLYYEASGRWCANREAAYDFGHSHAAIRFAVESGLTGVELVLAYRDPALDVTLPLEKPAGILDSISPPANPWRSTL